MTKIFCLEGITGAGKTTQAGRLNEYLLTCGKGYLIVNEKEYEPFKQVIINWHNESIKKFTKNKIYEIAKSRAETHKKHFIPLIGKLDYLIFDRSLYTSAIYQSEEDLSAEEIVQINIREGALIPNSGVVLLCSSNIAKMRIDERRFQVGKYALPSIHESLNEIIKRRESYIQLLIHHSELKLIETDNLSKDEVFNSLLKVFGI